MSGAAPPTDEFHFYFRWRSDVEADIETKVGVWAHANTISVNIFAFVL